jgi:hypothetical protein
MLEPEVQMPSVNNGVSLEPKKLEHIPTERTTVTAHLPHFLPGRSAQQMSPTCRLRSTHDSVIIQIAAAVWHISTATPSLALRIPERV